MSTIIQVNNKCRVRDYDKNQYVVEYMVLSKDKPGEFYWRPWKYCGSPKSVVGAVREYLGNEAANVARHAEEFIFDSSEIAKTLGGLPEKGKAGD